MFLYDVNEPRSGSGHGQATVFVNQVIDMRDAQFDVQSVTRQDVIHANAKDIPCIFTVEF